MMFGSETIPRDTRRSSGTSFLFSSNNNNFKHVSAEGEFLKSKELMGTSDNMSGNQNQPQKIQQSCGLARYRSAPGSFLGSLLESSTENSDNGEESEAFFRALMENGPLDLNQKDSEEMLYFNKQEARNGKNEFGGGEIAGSYSVGMETNINASNLGTQNNSPAEFYSGFGIMGEVGNYRVQNGNDPNPSSSGYINHMKFSSPSSTPRFMPSIPENGNETRSSENGGFRNRKEFESPSTQDSWNDERKKPFSNWNGLGNPNEETRKRSHGLVHHLSLPKSYAQAQVANGQKFLHFQQETVPCQTRAKRGFATHPRSIAERMRRTRISEKMKKLQDLFPNMDKQTNTADMLDLAVEHIKVLQKQVMTLTDARAKCACSSKQKPTSSTT
ncbi:transcription factor bHLH128-like isoform X2 [Primulina huaijiensis]|uniref:transcription factor bHLH128-like isoform X2 n=1 Tax=Primulina huaijiensis TaxID=1492673 RepID=UPI003CC70FF0